MFKEGDYVVYKRNVCRVKEVKENYFSLQDYYILAPIDDDSLIISVPVRDNTLRYTISKEEVENIIHNIIEIKTIEPINDKLIENEYKKLINSGKHEDLISIIKTTYLRNDSRLKNGKKIGEKDDNYLKMAEKTLYNEFSVALNMSYEATKKYVVEKVTLLECKGKK